MIELKALNPHWLESFEEPEYDLCVHSSVQLKIGNIIVSEKHSGIWTISATAYLFLKTLTEDQNSEKDEQLLPCCGFSFWKVENNIFFSNCGTGINWDIFHKNNKIVHKFKDTEIEVGFEEWREVIIKFSDDVLKFYEESAPRKFEDDESKKEFKYFLSELKRLHKEATK